MTTNYNITRSVDWDPTPDNFTFSKAATNKHGSTSIGFYYKDSRLYLKVPKMRVPFGLGRGMNDKGYNVQLSFDDKNPAALELLEKCKQFDETMINYGVDKAYEWNIVQKKGKNKEPSRDVIEDRYKPMVKYPRFSKSHERAGEINEEYPPYIQATLPETQGKDKTDTEPAVASEIITELYDKNKELLPINEDTIGKQCYCSALLYATSAYSSSTGWGVSWKAAQLMVFPRGGLPTGTCLIDDEDSSDEEDDMDNQDTDDSNEVGSSGTGSDDGANEDAEESEPEEPSDESSPESEPEPEPEPKKRTVTKKTRK